MLSFYQINKKLIGSNRLVIDSLIFCVFTLFIILFNASVCAENYLVDIKYNIAKAISILHVAHPDFQYVKDRLETADNVDNIKLALDQYFEKELHDPYSSYVTAEQEKNDKLKLSDESFGLGIEVLDFGKHVLVSPYQYAPTYNAGFREYSYVLKLLNGKALSKVEEISAIINSSEGKYVAVNYISTSSGNEILASIEPKNYKTLPVEDRLSEDIPSIRVRNFKKNVTTNEIARLIAHANKNNPNLTSFILDLRGCNGGDLQEAINSATLFLKSNSVIGSTVDSLGTLTEYRTPKNNSLITEKPILLLVDEFTASACEVFTAALTYNRVAIAIGSTTCGKCTSQTTLKLSDGSKLKLTDFKLLYPSGEYCDNKGIIPEYIIENTSDQLKVIKEAEKKIKNKRDVDVFNLRFGKGRCFMELSNGN